MALLSEASVARARRVNPYYQRRLGWPSRPPERDSTSVGFAYHIARLQRAARTLWVDGVLGPKTWAFMQSKKPWVPRGARHLLVAGEPLDVPFEVVTFEQPEGLSFYGQGGFRDRTDPTGKKIDLAVLHWDCCTSSHTCFHVLLERKLSAHLLVDGDGMVYQTLDLAQARASHAGVANERSIGIEIQNPVQPPTGYLPTSYNPKSRPLISEIQAHTGQPWQRLDYTEVQKTRVVQLIEALCERFGISRRLPSNADGGLSSRLPNAFSGVCGHYHVNAEKHDPGQSLWPLLYKAWGLPWPASALPPDAAVATAPMVPVQGVIDGTDAAPLEMVQSQAAVLVDRNDVAS